MDATILEPIPRSRPRVPGLTSAGHFSPGDRHPVDADPERVSRLPAHLPQLPPTNRSVPGNFLG